jgi:repressor LexA
MNKFNKLRAFYFEHHYIPSFREIAEIFNLKSPGAVSYWINQWKREGFITINKEKIIPTTRFFEFPLLGNIQAGTPTDNYAFEEFISLEPMGIRHPGHTYLLRVKGDSMIYEGIKEGDLVVLDKLIEPKSGDIIAANIDGEWTLKYLRNRNGDVFLEAANPKYPPIYPREKLEVGGVVVKVIRDYL